MQRRYETVWRIMIAVAVGTVWIPGCATSGVKKPPTASKQIRIGDKPRAQKGDGRVRRVVTMFDQRPWLNADAAADRDPEGLQYRVFLDVGASRGEYREGTFHIEMYQIDPKPGGGSERTLVSDYHYPSSEFTRIRANILGDGYHLRLLWARKDIAGHEIELSTSFEDPEGNIARSDTKRLRVPKYVS